MLTDGIISDMAQTKEAIVTVSFGLIFKPLLIPLYSFVVLNPTLGKDHTST